MLDHVLNDLGDLAANADRKLARAGSKSARFVAEMHEIAAAQHAAGLTPALFEAMAEVYAGVAETPLGRTAPEEAGAVLEEVLRELSDSSSPGRSRR